MNVFDHLIPDQAILGIGPLMMEHTASETHQQLYGTRRYLFELHLAAHTTSVKSNWFNVLTEEEHKKAMKQWREDYYQFREKIAHLIGEETDQRKCYEEQVETTYKDLFSVLGSLFEDTHPNDPQLQPSVNLRIERAYQDITQLRDLALK
jgi:hypothetical protein